VVRIALCTKLTPESSFCAHSVAMPCWTSTSSSWTLSRLEHVTHLKVCVQETATIEMDLHLHSCRLLSLAAVRGRRDRRGFSGVRLCTHTAGSQGPESEDLRFLVHPSNEYRALRSVTTRAGSRCLPMPTDLCSCGLEPSQQRVRGRGYLLSGRVRVSATLHHKFRWLHSRATL